MFYAPGKVKKNYERNAALDLRPAMDEEGMLNGQDREGLGSLAFGFSRVGKAGCESIAVYNALRRLGRPQPLARIIRDMEKGGYLRLGGHLGAVPYFQPLLKRYGAREQLITPARLRRDADRRALTPGAVFLMAIWNRRFSPVHGLHTFAAVYDPHPAGDWLVYNRFNTDDRSRRYEAPEDILRNGTERGAFFVIYRVYPLDER